jgi:hypothetical protein
MTPDLLADARLPGAKKKKPKEPVEEAPEPRKPIKQAWHEFHSQRTVDDTVKGCEERLDAIDVILVDFQEWLGLKVQRNHTKANKKA